MVMLVLFIFIIDMFEMFEYYVGEFEFGWCLWCVGVEVFDNFCGCCWIVVIYIGWVCLSILWLCMWFVLL